MVKTLLEKLLPPPNKYGIDSVKHLEITTKLKPTTEDGILKLLKSLKFLRQQLLIIFLEGFKEWHNHFSKNNMQNM